MATKDTKNYWFIRLGSKQRMKDRKLYQALAKEHSLIKIGYDITEDITGNNKDGIKNHLKTRKDKPTANQIGKMTDLVDKFINGIKEGDIVVCPFDNDNIQIGEVKSKCQTTESLFKDGKTEFKRLLDKHFGSQDEEENTDDIGEEAENRDDREEKKNNHAIQPARKVKWLDKEVSSQDFPENLKDELSTFMPAAVNKLNAEEIIYLSDIGNPVKVAAKMLVETKVDLVREREANRSWKWRAFITAVITVVLSFLGESFVNSCAKEIQCVSSLLWLWHKLQEIIMFFSSILWAFWEWVIFPFCFSIEILIGLIGFVIAESKICGQFLIRFRVVREILEILSNFLRKMRGFW